MNHRKHIVCITQQDFGEAQSKNDEENPEITIGECIALFIKNKEICQKERLNDTEKHPESINIYFWRKNWGHLDEKNS